VFTSATNSHVFAIASKSDSFQKQIPLSRPFPSLRTLKKQLRVFKADDPDPF
jgi:hypothetical protein